MSLFAQHSNQGEWRWTGLPDSTPDQALPLQGLLQAQAPERLLSFLPRINKHFVGFQFVRFQFATCHMPHGHLPHRLAVPSAGSAAASALSSAACDRQSSASFPFSMFLNLPHSFSLLVTASLPFPLALAHTHCQLPVAINECFLSVSFICRFSFRLSFSFDFVVFAL